MRSSPALVCLTLIASCGVFAAVGCSSTRIERYFTNDNAPQAVATPGVGVQLLYFKQSMRHFYATVRITNSGTTPLVFQRQGAGRADVLLQTEGKSYSAEAPSHASWSPWTGTVELTPEQLARLEIAPGASAEVSLRWEFPSNTSTYRFDWLLVFHGLRRQDQEVPDILLATPGEG
jgi:hypothetical protein